MMSGVLLTRNKYRKCLLYIQSNLLNRLAKSQNCQTTHERKFIRPKWKESNAATLYYKYFGVFSLDTFLHTFSYITDYLELLYYETIYENEYFETYNIRHTD